jgi:GT2 family glycosyltransferase
VSRTRPERVHAVIVNYNSTADAVACVESLLASPPVSSITLLDNASSQSERTALRDGLVRYESPAVRLIFLDTNVGFGGGVNRAIDSIDGCPDDAVWIVNPDVVVEHDAAERLLAALGRFDVVSPLIYSGEPGRSFLWYGGGDIDVRRGLTATWQEEHVKRLKGAALVSFITGACPMMRLSTWRESGGFREDLFLYWEDTELCLRLARAGSLLAVEPSARVWHRVGGSGESAGKSALYYYYMNRNRLWVCGEHAPKLGILAGPGARYTVRLLAAAARERNGRGRKLKAALRGITHGLLAGRHRRGALIN